MKRNRRVCLSVPAPAVKVILLCCTLEWALLPWSAWLLSGEVFWFPPALPTQSGGQRSCCRSVCFLSLAHESCIHNRFWTFRFVLSFQSPRNTTSLENKSWGSAAHIPPSLSPICPLWDCALCSGLLVLAVTQRLDHLTAPGEALQCPQGLHSILLLYPSEIICRNSL